MFQQTPAVLFFLSTKVSFFHLEHFGQKDAFQRTSAEFFLHFTLSMCRDMSFLCCQNFFSCQIQEKKGWRVKIIFYTKDISYVDIIIIFCVVTSQMFFAQLFCKVLELKNKSNVKMEERVKTSDYKTKYFN